MPRLYDRQRWRRERRLFLRQNPLCRLCREAGRVAGATVVDHIEPHKGNPRLFWSWTNWQPLCKPCHDGTKKQQEGSGALRGCDEDGNPLDPEHRWNR